MIAQRVIAGAVAFDGVARLVMSIVAPIRNEGTRITIAVVYLAVAVAGFLVVRWDQRERERAEERRRECERDQDFPRPS